ncbi:MAG: SMC-Scp complex subunit ScpB [Oscillospiraceae bacterium]|nr:SMC-Scp complex subunit ScpB [Oscillospiraceae bacterium]
MDNKTAAAAVEAVLFACGDPVTISRLSDILELEVEEVSLIADMLAQSYKKRGSGLRLLRLGDNLQMCTHEDFAAFVRAALVLRRNTPLSQAALECLAVIAYNQPVTKAFVEQVRGVDCSGVVNSLAEKELVEERGRLDAPGRPLLYGTTANFLRCFGLTALEDLPKVDLPNEEIPQQEEMVFEVDD